MIYTKKKKKKKPKKTKKKKKKIGSHERGEIGWMCGGYLLG
jgi:hypothetical protein